MEWIKNNFEKLILVVCGLFALIIGGWLSASAFSQSEAGTNAKVTERSELGPDKTADVAKALTDLTAFAGPDKHIWSSVKLGPHQSIRAFTASPMLAKAGVDEAIRILDETTTPVREGVPNWWLYENGLDITRSDILKLDSDSDKYNNQEEFQGGSDPRNPDSQPEFYTKLRFIEKIEIPYEIKFVGVDGQDISVKRMAPLMADGRQASRLDAKVGEEIFKDDKRFKIKGIEDREAAVDGQKAIAKHLVLIDSLNPDKPVVIQEKATINLATYQAKIKSLLSGSEDTKKEGEEFKLPDFTGYKILLSKIGEDFIEIEYTVPGKPVKKAKLMLTK